jgi:hypothetical protein
MDGFCFICNNTKFKALFCVEENRYHVYYMNYNFSESIASAGVALIEHVREYINDGFWKVVALIRNGKVIK